MYIGGYAVECALAALICYHDCKTNYRDTRAGQFVKGKQVHSLGSMLNFTRNNVKNAIQLDRTNKLRNAWHIVSGEWQYGKLRYYDKMGDQDKAERFVNAVKVIHDFFIRQQGE